LGIGLAAPTQAVNASAPPASRYDAVDKLRLAKLPAHRMAGRCCRGGCMWPPIRVSWLRSGS